RRSAAADRARETDETGRVDGERLRTGAPDRTREDDFARAGARQNAVAVDGDVLAIGLAARRRDAAAERRDATALSLEAADVDVAERRRPRRVDRQGVGAGDARPQVDVARAGAPQNRVGPERNTVAIALAARRGDGAASDDRRPARVRRKLGGRDGAAEAGRAGGTDVEALRAVHASERDRAAAGAR